MVLFRKRQPNLKADDPSAAELEREKSITETQTQASTTETIIDVKPPNDEKDKKVPPVGFFELFRFSTKSERFVNVLALVAAAAAGAAQPLMSLIFGNLTQSFVNFGAAVTNETMHPSAELNNDLKAAAGQFRHEAAKDALILVLIGVGMFVCTWFFMLVWGWTGEINAKRVRERYLQAVLRQDIAYFDNVGAGEIATRIQTDTHLVQQGTSEKVALVVQFTSAFITGFIIAYIRSWRLALALTSIFPCLMITGAVMNKFLGKWIQLSLKHVAEGGTLAEEVISTIRTAHAFGSQKTLGGLYDEHIKKAEIVEMKGAIVHGCGIGTFFFIIYSAYALAFYFGTTLILDHLADAGVVVNVFMAILIGSFSLVILAPDLQAITQARGAAAKLYATIDRVPSIDSLSPEGMKLPVEKVHGEIEFTDVQFNYPSRPTVPILKSLSIKFTAGKTAALVGASGSGKSTIVSLVERFYDPLAGTISLDGHDIKTLNLTWLRSQIGLVSQEPVLFATTIFGNVAHGLIGSRFENVSDAEKERLVKEACEKANADGFISKLPNGYQTLVGERGFLLSGGQKQRIAIARAIVSDPRILLLDEATSALDTQSEGIVQNALDKAAAGRTTISIAHRLSTIKNAEMIYVMGTGEVLENGTHDELLSKAGAYAKLVAAQKLREAEEKRGAGSDSDDDESLPGGGIIEQPAVGSLGGAPLTKATTRGSIKSKQRTEPDYDLEAAKEIPLGRKDTSQSLASAVLKRKEAEGTLISPTGEDQEYSLFYLFRRMYALNRNALHLYLLGAFAAACTGAVYPSFGIVYAKAIVTFQNDSTTSEGRHALRVGGNRNALWFFIISIVSSMAITIQNYLFSRTATMLTTKLRSLGFKSILRQDIEFFDQEKHSTGSLTSNLSDNPQKVNGLAGITLGAIVQSCATLIIGMIIGLIFGAKLAAVGIATIPFVVSAGYIRLRVVVLKDQANKKTHEESAHMACEAAGAIRTVASLTREGDCLRLYSDSLKVAFQRAYRTNSWSTGFFALSQSMAFFSISLVFWYGSRLVSTMEYTTNQFFICLFTVTFGAIQAGNVFGFVPDISAAKGAASDIINLLDSRPSIDTETTEGKVPKGVQGEVVLQDVHFRYPTRPQVRVLRGLDIVARPGTYVALVGASGCGKSTVIQLIERFYDPLAGKILMDGQEIDEFNVQEYRKNIALVSQEPTLYAGTVRFNILLGATKPAEEVTKDEIEAACRDANILDFINSLPDGFDTEVGGKGAQLSGGQKQRIAIARALLRNPKVLLLDEATSALDSQSEKVVQEALDQAAKGRTTIAIAHRLSTIQNADCIYFLKEGRVFESGTHDELTAKKGAYYEYTQLQQLSKQH